MAKGNAIRYHRDDIDAMIRATVTHRQKLTKAGLVDHAGRLTPAQPPTPPAPEPVRHNGFCMKCKKKVDAITEKVEDTKNGSSHVSGKCETCGTGVHTFHKKTDGDKLKKALDDQAKAASKATLKV